MDSTQNIPKASHGHNVALPAAPGDPVRSDVDARGQRETPELGLANRHEKHAVPKHPTFGQWLKLIWLDLLTLAVLAGSVIPLLLFAHPIGTRVFPLGGNGSMANPNLAYPDRPHIIASWISGLTAIAIPIAIILLSQMWIRSFWDAHHGILGFVYALAASAAFEAVIKALIGGFRPSFYDACKPDRARASGTGDRTKLNGVGYGGGMWSTDVCTANRNQHFRDSMRSFPSGHATTSVAAAVYLSLYLNARLKTFGRRHAAL